VALEALDLQPGDEVVTSPFTFAATLNAILDASATARFVDINEGDFNVDVSRLDGVLGTSTRCVVPVHLYGCPADMEAMKEFADPRGVAIVEDAAQAHGASVGERAVGSFGVGAFSFYATKNMTTGEGGMVTTDDDYLANRIRLLRSQGTRGRYEYELPGHNYRMTELQAALGLAELDQLEGYTERRRKNAESLLEGLTGVKGIELPFTRPGLRHVYHQFTIRVTAESRLDRDELATALAKHGVETAVYYPRPVYDYPCYRSHPRVRLDPTPRAERAGREVLSLPVHPWLSTDDLERIVAALRDALGEEN
jgi:dTDP-4-amino-4,6-dideoxygalactose transaminase